MKSHITMRWPRRPAHAASRAKARAKFSGWKKSRAASCVAAQKGTGADNAIATQGDSARSAGTRDRKKRYAAGAEAASPAEPAIKSTVGLGHSFSTAASSTK